MSGLCGIVTVAGSTPLPGQIEAMLDVLARRGPDGRQSWSKGPVALGHASLATTPEAEAETLPFTHSPSGCTIVADARIDNRDELQAALGLPSGLEGIGDGELILLAYLRWDDDCVRHLLGDFAFAIWDPRAEKLYCARDHMGMRQLVHHHHAGRHFTFATDVEALLAYRGVPRGINDQRIADYLEGLEGADLTSTFFNGVHRLPPAHWLTWRDDTLVVRRYWELRPGKPLLLKSDQEYEQAFLAMFTEAVRVRLRGRAVGAMLSGGVDSGSVVAIASRLLAGEGQGPLPTFSAIDGDARECVESRSIGIMQGTPNTSPRTIDRAQMDDLLDDLDRLTDESAEPFDASMVMIRALYLAANRAGVKVVLDGAGGDVVLTSSNRVAAHLRRGYLLRAWREARAEERYWKIRSHAMRTLLAAAWVAFIPTPLRNLRRRLLLRGQIHRLGSRQTSDRRARWKSFQGHIDHRNLRDPQRRANSIRHPHLTVGRERYERLAGALGIEPRDPFMDIRLIEFCLSLPAHLLQSDGWPKWILRRAMDGILPREVAWRAGKEHLGGAFIRTVLNRRPEWRHHLVGSVEESHAIDLYFLERWLERNALQDRT